MTAQTFAPVALVSGTVHQLSYVAGLVFQANASIAGSTAFDPQEPFVLAVFLVGAAAMLASVRRGASVSTDSRATHLDDRRAAER